MSDYVAGLPTPQQKAMAEYFSTRSVSSPYSTPGAKPVVTSTSNAVSPIIGPNVVGPVTLTPQYETAPLRRSPPTPNHIEPSIDEPQSTPRMSNTTSGMSPLTTDTTRGVATPFTTSKRAAEYFPDIRVTPNDTIFGSPRPSTSTLSPTSTVIADANSNSNTSTFLPSPTTPVGINLLRDPLAAALSSPTSTLSTETATGPGDGPTFCDVPMVGISHHSATPSTPPTEAGDFNLPESPPADTSASASSSFSHANPTSPSSSLSESHSGLMKTREEALFQELNYLVAPFPPNELDRVTALRR